MAYSFQEFEYPLYIVVLKDSDMESENLSLLILLSVSDGQNTGSLKVVSCSYRYMYIISTQMPCTRPYIHTHKKRIYKNTVFIGIF